MLENMGRRETAKGADTKVRMAPEELIVPVADQLKRDSKEELYYKTDHHWMAKGAFSGYQAWAKSVGIKPWQQDAFDRRVVTEEFHGTIYSKLNFPWEFDTIETWIPKELREYKVSFDGESATSDSLYFYDALKGKDKYAVYLDGNHAITKIVNEAADGDMSRRKLLIIKDSYAHSFAVFAANHYGITYMADLRYLNISLKEWMEEQEITDVLVLYQIPGFAKEKSVLKLSY